MGVGVKERRESRILGVAGWGFAEGSGASEPLS